MNITEKNYERRKFKIRQVTGGRHQSEEKQTSRHEVGGEACQDFPSQSEPSHNPRAAGDAGIHFQFILRVLNRKDLRPREDLFAEPRDWQGPIRCDTVPIRGEREEDRTNSRKTSSRHSYCLRHDSTVLSPHTLWRQEPSTYKKKKKYCGQCCQPNRFSDRFIILAHKPTVYCFS